MSFPANPFDQRFPAHDDQGPREEQQDACITLKSAELGTALLVVSDGVGGKSGGRMAARKVVELAEVLWKERGGLFPDPKADLASLCRVAHQQINELGRKHDTSPRATIVALYLDKARAYWAHSGDSRLYHFRGGKFVSRTEDHSVVQVLVRQGLAKESEMGTHPDQGTLLQSLGGEDYKEPGQGAAEIGEEDGFLLCSDGFWERTPPPEMAALLACPAAEAGKALRHAVERAVSRNGPKGDNVTAALALPAVPGSAVLPPAVSGLFKTLILAFGTVALLGIVWLWMSGPREKPVPVAPVRVDKSGDIQPKPAAPPAQPSVTGVPPPEHSTLTPPRQSVFKPLPPPPGLPPPPAKGETPDLSLTPGKDRGAPAAAQQSPAKVALPPPAPRKAIPMPDEEPAQGPPQGRSAAGKAPGKDLHLQGAQSFTPPPKRPGSSLQPPPEMREPPEKP